MGEKRQKPEYEARVSSTEDGRYLGEVVEKGSGTPAGLSTTDPSRKAALEFAQQGAQELNEHDVRYDG